MQKFKEPFFRYKFNWDKGPLVGVRYQLYSWQDFALFARAEYRWAVGWGGALETDFAPKNHPTRFITRSYVGTDRLQNAPDAKFRYRLQGDLDSKTQNKKTRVKLSWDKYSDVRMPSDFKSLDFELNTAKKTLAFVRHQEKDWIGWIKARPRVNSFETINQDLPAIYVKPLPKMIGNSGVLSDFHLKASYMNFAYSDQLATSLHDFKSARFEVKEKLSRSFLLGPCTFTPHVGGGSILYSNSPQKKGRPLAFLNYGIDLLARGKKNYTHFKHVIEPHAEFFSYTHPTVSIDKHYIFSIDDGYSHINQFQAGIRSLLFSKDVLCQAPLFSFDLFANAFLSDSTIPQLIPKLYLNLDWNFPSASFSWKNAWNFRHQVLDYSNAKLLWTLSEHVALSLEGRYRSRYDWRKADHQNFFLDVTRQESDLLLSPLSDQRVTLLTHLFIRFNPFWECHFQSHHGFYREDQKPYNELKLDLFTWVSTACKIRLSLTRVAKYNKIRPSFGFNFYK